MWEWERGKFDFDHHFDQLWKQNTFLPGAVASFTGSYNYKGDKGSGSPSKNCLRIFPLYLGHGSCALNCARMTNQFTIAVIISATRLRAAICFFLRVACNAQKNRINCVFAEIQIGKNPKPAKIKHIVIKLMNSCSIAMTSSHAHSDHNHGQGKCGCSVLSSLRVGWPLSVLYLWFNDSDIIKIKQ